MSLEEGTSWKSRRISAGAGMDRSREDTRPEGGQANQDRLEDREEIFNVIYKSWGPWDLKEERSIICFVPGGLSEAKQPTRLEFGVEKYLLQDHASRLVSQASLKPLLARF